MKNNLFAVIIGMSCVACLTFCSSKEKKKPKIVESNVAVVQNSKVKEDSVKTDVFKIDTTHFKDITEDHLKSLYKIDSLVNEAEFCQRIYEVSDSYAIKAFDTEMMNVVLGIYPSFIVEEYGMPQLEDFDVLKNFVPITINKEAMRLLVLKNNYSSMAVAMPEFYEIAAVYIPGRKRLHVFYCSKFELKKNGFVLIHLLRDNRFEVKYKYYNGDFIFEN